MKAMSIIGAVLSIVGMFYSYVVTNAGDCLYFNSSLSKNDTESIGGIIFVINLFLLVFSILVFIKSNKK
jgi:hypothetical protein